ncbi:MAG TPA: hypothetical protein VFS20_09285 [Longimicrobium sp.]|nr:hypothetical protein [Longimicrobium sp.]
MPDPIILLKTFVEVGSAAEAEAERRRIVARLEGDADVETSRVQQYWKILEYWEISLNLHPTGPALALYQRLIAMAEAGWLIGEVPEEEEDPERWAVWNAAPGVEFLTPKVVWAEVQLLPRGLNREPADRDDFDDLQDIAV